MSDFNAAKKRLEELLEDYEKCPPVQTQLDIRLLLAEVERLRELILTVNDHLRADRPAIAAGYIVAEAEALRGEGEK